jgi:hypothetical protein
VDGDVRIAARRRSRGHSSPQLHGSSNSALAIPPEELSDRPACFCSQETIREVIMGRPLSPLELKEMAERLPSTSARKAPRKSACAKASTKRAGVRLAKRRK